MKDRKKRAIQSLFISLGLFIILMVFIGVISWLLAWSSQNHYHGSDWPGEMNLAFLFTMGGFTIGILLIVFSTEISIKLLDLTERKPINLN